VRRPDEAVKAFHLGDDAGAGTHVEVVGVGEDDARPEAVEVIGGERLHSCLRADRHEGRCLEPPSRQRRLGTPCIRVRAEGGDGETEHRPAAWAIVHS